ncbi:iron-containing alcohol dehydrogenase, partial [Anaerofustis stercorihominis]
MKKDGAKKAYIVYGGKSAKKSGLLDKVEKSLKDENIEYKMI